LSQQVDGFLPEMKTETILKMLDKIAESVEPVSQARLAAAIVYKNDVISIGINQKKSHPFQRRFSKHEEAIFLHAEVDAIKNALRHISIDQLAKSKLYVTRVRYETSEKHIHTSNLRRGLAKPCQGCMKAIATFNIKHVCFSTDEGHNFL
jgi:deoxycytidylate deaminase